MNNRIEHFQLMAKPSGAVCNIDCSYCFYLEKEHLYPERKSHWKMDSVTLENYIKKNIKEHKDDVVDFMWQGGEPTLLGIDFYKDAIRLQNIYKERKHINNYFQTNGININDEWAKFLKENNFLVGLSIDGDRISNDSHRKTRSGKSTFDALMSGLASLKKFKVEFNTLTVVNSENVKRPMDVYNFLKRIGSQYIQFIPLVERKSSLADENGLTLIKPDFIGKSEVTEWSSPSKAYGNFLNTIFDHWVQNDLGSTFVMNFEQTMTKMLGRPSGCVINETCGGNIIIEANGDIYSCDHFVYPENKIGNINKDDLLPILNSEQHIDFSNQKQTNLSVDCVDCIVRPVCNGGCPKHRFLISSNGKPNKNYFCSGYYTHLHHATPIMSEIITLLQKNTTSTKIRKNIKSKFF
ncbi:anaerobic sulfatase maturase [Tolumonas auensis]|uniref:anaerobic sulfatase maturase n=1 Tax=Tolumonas auensis TaxID=43948 RepID=UPI002AA9100B|nr:anaerobic sulfatase maturase [Tolumonas auensis]